MTRKQVCGAFGAAGAGAGVGALGRCSFARDMRFDRDNVGHNLGYDVRDSARRSGLRGMPGMFQLVEPLVGQTHQLALASPSLG